ncbi:hypothetical protein B5F90_10455 [Alistipes sp. An31A]|uniref:hypothetical protein n=1 Tax=Alistipes sp. An31A TaxID=1965631 RepID=UPI000B3A51D6|nr:hypothetical protein [Alistipes sp. An31A]OUO18234.1 hypothetical protein B5F90_10455 [Alistipes sp. An31A]
MKNQQIQAHQFELAKCKIKDTSNKVTDVSLSPFETKGKFLGSWSNHNITGKEMNDFVKTLQKTFIEINNNTRTTYNFIGEVYSAFDALDKEYIQGILTAIESSKKASDQARKASDQALRAQIDINQTVEALQLTVKSLLEFKKTMSNNLTIIRNSLIQITSLEDCNQDIPNIKTSNDSQDAVKIKQQQQNQYDKRIRILYFIIGGSLALTIGQFLFLIITIISK